MLLFFVVDISHSQDWKKVDDLSAGVRIEMPANVYQKKETVFVQNRPTVMTIYVAEEDFSGTKYFFTSLKVEGEISKKRKKKILHESLVLASVRHIAKTFNKSKISMSDQYIGVQAELLTSDNQYIKLRSYMIEQYLVTVYVVSKNNENQTAIDDYLNGLSLSHSSNELVGDAVNSIHKDEYDWAVFDFDDFELSFPITPFEQRQLVVNGDRQEEYVYHFANDQYNDIVYLVNVLESTIDWDIDVAGSKAIYSLEELYDAKVIEHKEVDFLRFPAKEYILKNHNRFYRVRYYFIGNKLYQLIVQSNYPTVNSFRIEKYFDSFTLKK